MFWNFFVMMVRVMDPATVQQAIGIIGGVRRSPPIGDTRNQGVSTMRENKPKSGSVSISRIPANTGKPHKTARFGSCGKCAFFSLRLPKYGRNAPRLLVTKAP
jgi:hypothetical protein